MHKEATHQRDGKNGEKLEDVTWLATDFDEEIDFPFKLAKPQVLDAAARAMAFKIFDDIGMLPTHRGADPMIIGRVEYREGYHRKFISFLITWFINTSEI